MLCVTRPSSYRQTKCDFTQASVTGQPSRQPMATCKAAMFPHVPRRVSMTPFRNRSDGSVYRTAVASGCSSL